MSEFSELHDDLRSIARSMLADHGGEDRIWADVTTAGWTGLEVHEALGGAGVTFAETAVVVEELGRAMTSTPFFGTAVLGVAAASAAATKPERDDLLQALAVGETQVAVVLSPHGDGAAPDPAFAINARRRLTGRAEWVIDAPLADAILVVARDADGKVVLASVAAPQLEVTTRAVLDETRCVGTVEARGVPVGSDAVWALDGDGFAALQRLFDRAALGLAIDSLGVASAMLDQTVAYVSMREQFGRPVGSFQAVKHICADMLVQLRIGRELVTAGIGAINQADAGALSVAASQANAYVTAAAVDVVGAAMQLHGGIGYTWEQGIHRYLKRALLNRSLLGSPAAHRRNLGSRLAVDDIDVDAVS